MESGTSRVPDNEYPTGTVIDWDGGNYSESDSCLNGDWRTTALVAVKDLNDEAQNFGLRGRPIDGYYVVKIANPPGDKTIRCRQPQARMR